MKKFVAVAALASVLSLGMCGGMAFASYGPGVDYSKYEKGVTVEEDAASPTGYSATFIYEQQDSYSNLSGEVVKVELYSDCMLNFTYKEGFDKPFSPDEYRIGMYPAGGSGDTTYYAEMSKFAEGLWGVKIPLTSGAFVYNFRVTDLEGNKVARLDDPNNATMLNTSTNIHSLSSMVYVPYSAAKTGTGIWADRTVENPVSPDQKGTVRTVSYTGADGTQHGLAVYLPLGYDENRAEPYKVLYLSHGTSGDIYGNELRWMNEGAVPNIMDHLIASGKTEPFVVVTMNNQQYSMGEGHSGPNWNYLEIENDQINYIMPYVEQNFNVSRTADGRAYAGLSMGGTTTSNMLMYHQDLFSYYGIWSYANVDGSVGGVAGIQDSSIQARLTSMETKPNIMLAAGSWDFGLEPVKAFGGYLDAMGMNYSFTEVPAAHDWECWQMIYADAVENFFWKN